MSKVLETFLSWYCPACKTMPTVYSQGLSCECEEKWHEYINEEEYPKHWHLVRVVVETINE